MAEYRFYARDTDGHSLGNVRIIHDRRICPHDNGCVVGGSPVPDCNDNPYTLGTYPRVREVNDRVIRLTNRDGMARMFFGICAEDHEFQYEHNGHVPDNVQKRGGGREIYLFFEVLPQVEHEEPQPPAGHGYEGMDLPPIGAEETVHPCFRPTKTTGKPCKRRTSDAYCYQHVKTPIPGLKKFAGTWLMDGRQASVQRSAWEARLELRANGTLTWKETKGANVGAQRDGRWELEGSALHMRYQAPIVGWVDWVAHNPQPTNISGTYRTPEVDPKGVGWGGDWSASKATT
jgi:hypothetical protein